MKSGNSIAIWIALCVYGLAGPVASQEVAESTALLPRVEDYTSMWWVDGFPGHFPDVPWQRCIQTGYYAMVLDTETLRIPHFGRVPVGGDYAACGRSAEPVWQDLPPAELVLRITADGTTYDCTQGGKWTSFTGPRLIESGRFMQRADVTDLVFVSPNGESLNVEARLETVAWPDRLGVVLAARPGLQPIAPGEASFGRIGGGFGLDGSNHLEIPHRPELDPEQFTLELWVFLPTDYRVSERTFPWLVCKNHNEAAEGNFGIILLNGRPQARLNVGGGRDNQFVADAQRGRPLKFEAWNHLAISYDGDVLQLYVNGEVAGEQKVGRQRVPGKHALAFGRRQDNSGDGYHFRGIVDEIRLYDRALKPAEVRRRFNRPGEVDAAVTAVHEWSFRADGIASDTKFSEQWRDAALEINLRTERGVLRNRVELPVGQTWMAPQWQEAFIAVNPASLQAEPSTSPVKVQAFELPDSAPRSVDYVAARGWHRVDLNGIEPIVPEGGADKQNDAIERVRLVLSNPTEREQVARLLFEKDGSGMRQRIGASITGVSAMLRDSEGHPTGIPVQLSKNWHNRAEGGVYAGGWFHGFSQVRLPAKSTVELELTLVYGHWGGVAAASHAQLCLIGWGSNQRWDESALGSWGESICYEPDQVQADCSILDVRPVMVGSMNHGQPWGWTHNVGGGDIFRMFTPAGERLRHSAMRAAYHRYGPCLTEVTYSGRLGRDQGRVQDHRIEHAATVSLARTDDLVRGIYRLRLDVKEAAEFSRFVIFQIGADTYSYTGEQKMAVGNETGLIKEWATEWGGNVYRMLPLECTGRVAWVSLHEAVRGRNEPQGAWANRGIVIRSWKARLGGKNALPWIAEHGVNARGNPSSTLDIVPPPSVTRLEPGDFVEATIEHVVMPQFAKDYYGPNAALRAALTESENSWRMIYREAVGNDRQVEMTTGTLQHVYPNVSIRTQNDEAECTLARGLGYVPVTFTDLTSWRGYTLLVDGHPVDQSVHGNDFWQTDYDPVRQRWSRTYNVPVDTDAALSLHFVRAQ